MPNTIWDYKNEVEIEDPFGSIELSPQLIADYCRLQRCGASNLRAYFELPWGLIDRSFPEQPVVTACIIIRKPHLYLYVKFAMFEHDTQTYLFLLNPQPCTKAYELVIKDNWKKKNYHLVPLDDNDSAIQELLFLYSVSAVPVYTDIEVGLFEE